MRRRIRRRVSSKTHSLKMIECNDSILTFIRYFTNILVMVAGIFYVFLLVVMNFICTVLINGFIPFLQSHDQPRTQHVHCAKPLLSESYSESATNTQ